MSFVPRLTPSGARLFFCSVVNLLPGTCVVEMQERGQFFAEGEWDVLGFPFTDAEDEVGQLAKAFNQMTQVIVRNLPPALQVDEQGAPVGQELPGHHLRRHGHPARSVGEPDPHRGRGLRLQIHQPEAVVYPDHRDLAEVAARQEGHPARVQPPGLEGQGRAHPALPEPIEPIPSHPLEEGPQRERVARRARQPGDREAQPDRRHDRHLGVRDARDLAHHVLDAGGAGERHHGRLGGAPRLLHPRTEPALPQREH